MADEYIDIYVDVTPEEKKYLDEILEIVNENKTEKVGYEWFINTFCDLYLQGKITNKDLK